MFKKKINYDLKENRKSNNNNEDNSLSFLLNKKL